MLLIQSVVLELLCTFGSTQIVSDLLKQLATVNCIMAFAIKPYIICAQVKQ